MTAYYVEPDPLAAGGEAYWLEGYAVGDAKLAALAPAGVGVMDMGAVRVRESGNQSETFSESIGVGGFSYLFGVDISGTSSSFYGGNRVLSAAISKDAGSATVMAPIRKLSFVSASSYATSELLLSGRKKWQDDASVFSVWADDVDTSSIWQDDVDTSALWGDASDASGASWGDASNASSSTWTDR